MTLLEYVTSLQDTGLSQEEIFAKAQEFKGRTKPAEVEVVETPVEEVKTEVVAEEGVPAATTPVTPESSSSGSGTFTSMYDEDAIAKLKLEDINRQIERSIATDAQRALKTSKIVFQDEYESFDPYGTGEAGEIGLESRKSTLGLVESKPVSEEDKLIRSFKESTDLSKDQFDSLYRDIYDNENLFTPVETQRLIEGSTGSGMDIKMGLMTPSLQETITIIPNEEELKTALKQLESKPRKIGAPKISKQEIEDRAKQNMFNSRARDIKMQNATDFIFNISEYKKDEDGNFLRDEEGNKILNRKVVKDLIAENITTNRNKATWNVEDFGKDLELSLSKFQESSLVENFESYSKALKVKQEKIKKLADSIVKKQKNGKPVFEDLIEYKNEANSYKSFIDQYNKLGLNLKNESIDLENRVVEYNDMISSIEDSDVQLDALGRVYDKFEKRYTDLVLGAAGIAINSAAFLETALNQMSVRSLELDEEGKPTGELAPGSTFFQDEAKKLATVKEFVSNKYYKPVSFKNAFNSIENFAEYGIDQAIAQAPIFGAIASGGLGMFAVSAASAGEYQAGRQLEAEQLFGREADETTVFLQALGFGASEYVFGVGPTALILKGTYRGATASGKRKILDGWKNYFRTIKKDGPLDLGLAMVDAAGEGLTTISQNGIDGKPLFENVAESVFTGGLFGSLTASAPYFKGAFAAALSDYKTNTDYRENLKMINTLDRSLNNPWITEADKAGIEKSKQDLIDQNNEIVEQRVNLSTNNLNKQGGELLQQSMKRQEELRNQAEALENNNSIPDNQKASILNALEAEFDQIEAGADKFKQAFTNTFGLLSNKEQSRLKTEAERLLKVDGSQNISGDKIARKAEQLHTKEKLEQTLQSDQSTLKALAGAGIEVGYSVEDTNAGAIKSFTAMMNFRAADKNNSITQEQADSLIEEFTEGINDGTLNGFNVPSTNTKTGKKVYDSITSVQNSIANERSQTSLHELGHVITTEALGSDPAAFEETKNLILSYLEKANPEAYTRITTRTRGQSADEVLMVFFEEVADNKIKLEKAKGTGFLGYLGSMLGTASSKASNTDYNYNFKGETDIVNFAKELGRKLKDGTLTVEDVKTIQQEGLGGKKEAPVIPLDEVVVTGAAASKSSKETAGANASAKVQEIYDAQGEAGAFDIIEQFKPIVRRIVDKRQDAPNFDRQLLTDEIETGKRGIFDLIREYNPESGVPLAAYINKFLPARAIEASQRVLGETFTEDVTEARGIAAEEVTTEVAEKPVTRKIKPSSFISNDAVTKIKEQIQEKIKGIDPKNLTFKKLGDLAPEIIAAEIGIPVKKLTVATANLSKGDATAIQQFVNKNADKLLKILPEGAVVEAATEKLLGTSTGVPKGLLNAFYTKQARLGKGAGLAPFKLNKGISKVDFLETFGVVEGKKAEGFDARSPQAQALKGIASLYGKLVTNEIVRSDTDLSLETKQDVAAGKNKAMASREVDIKNRFNTASTTKTGGVSKANNVDPISRGSVEYMGGKGSLKTETRWTPSKEDIAYIPTFMNKAAGLFGKDFFTTGNFAFGGRSLIGTRPDLTKALEGAAYNKDAPKMPKRKPYKKTKKYDKNFHEKLNTKEFLDNEKAKMPYLKFIFEQIQADLKTNPNHLKYWEAVLNDAQNSQGHFMRFLAPIAFYPVDKNGNPVFDQDIVEEHTMPQSNVAAFLLQSALDGNIEKDFGFIEDNYFQGALLLADDKKTRGKDYNYISNMGETFLESDNPSSWMRYNNENVNDNQGGIDFNSYKLLNGQTIAESLDAGLPLKDRTPDALENQRNEILKQLKDPSYKAKEAIQVFKELAPGMAKASKENNNILPEAIKYDKDVTVQTTINALEKTDKALELARKLDQPVKKIRVFDFDDTLARTKSNVLYTMPDGTTGAIDAATFAKEAGNMEAEGAQWDFSEFSKVMQGSKGPLLDVAKIIADKRGTKDVFVLTARPADAAGPIKEFLASMGLDIPLANITGLGDGAPQAKAGWIMGKAAEGYNDFYFADDHTGNVKAVKDVLSQIDVKSKVQLAKASKEQTFDTIVNDMIEDSSGIETYKKYSAAKAKTVGASKGKYAFLIPPSAEDFTGLLYKMIGKGKKGDAQMAFLKTNLLDTYNRAESAVTQAKVSAANDFVALKTELKTLPKTLSKETGVGKFTYSHAVRVSVWTKQGMTIPGLSKRDVKELNDFVNKDAKLRVFTDELIKIQKGKEYPKPGKDWLGGNITTDIIGGINKVNRAEYQQEWRENIDIIFSEDNMNKMEAAYGTRWREAMEDSIRRMKSGSNRPIGGNRVTEGLLNWLNNSVGAVMFLNTRSALLQTISAVNFINLGDNNIIKAGRAFANQKQFWGDFMTLMNSDYLVERRNGLKINVSESEIADAVRESKNKPKAAIAFLLSKGFVMTRFADSFAIASGGSTFYRNRLEALKKQGLSDADAKMQAFEDFKAIAEENQQSSSPSKISQQQASAAGRVILAWANTPMQYARIQKRAAQDLINKRGDWKSNISKIVYYGAIQNLIFNALQQAVFALGFGDDEEETDEAKAKKRNDKAYKVVNGMIDSQLKGLGIFGAASVAIKNTLTTLYEEHGKKGSKYENAVADLLSFSPPLGSKIGKIRGGLRSASWNKKDMKEKGFSLDNPAYMAGAQVVTGLTNIPLDRVAKKINNLRGLVNERSSLWQKVALGLGWGTWELGLGYYGGWDKKEPLTPKQELQLEVDKMKKDTSKPDQVKTLLDFGLTKKQIRELKNENNRVKKILELQKKDKNEK